jgi:hypothetical protein
LLAVPKGLRWPVAQLRWLPATLQGITAFLCARVHLCIHGRKLLQQQPDVVSSAVEEFNNR